MSHWVPSSSNLGDTAGSCADIQDTVCWDVLGIQLFHTGALTDLLPGHGLTWTSQQVCILKQVSVYFSDMSRVHPMTFDKFKAALQM